jgi:hypothetical protein
VDLDPAAMKVRKPLGDRTNKQRMKSSLGSVEDVATKPVVLSHEMTRGILQSSEEDVNAVEGPEEPPKVDADGFVIWDDADEEGVVDNKDAEIAKLRAALKEALDENHRLHAEAALNRVDQEELRSARNQLETIAELYEMAKREIEALKGEH